MGALDVGLANKGGPVVTTFTAISARPSGGCPGWSGRPDRGPLAGRPASAPVAPRRSCGPASQHGGRLAALTADARRMRRFLGVPGPLMTSTATASVGADVRRRQRHSCMRKGRVQGAVDDRPGSANDGRSVRPILRMDGADSPGRLPAGEKAAGFGAAQWFTMAAPGMSQFIPTVFEMEVDFKSRWNEIPMSFEAHVT